MIHIGRNYLDFETCRKSQKTIVFCFFNHFAMATSLFAKKIFELLYLFNWLLLQLQLRFQTNLKPFLKRGIILRYLRDRNFFRIMIYDTFTFFRKSEWLGLCLSLCYLKQIIGLKMGFKLPGKELSMLIHMPLFFYLKEHSSKKRKDKKSDKLLHCSVGVLSIEYSHCTCRVPRSVNWWTNSNSSRNFQNTFEIIRPLP